MGDPGADGTSPTRGLALAWVLVVTAVAAVTFVVVDRAGRGVGQASAARTVAPLPSGSTSPSATDGAGGPTTGPTPGATATATPEEPAPGSTTPAPATSEPSTPAPAPAVTMPSASPRTASFTTEGGTVVAACTDETLLLVSITPRDGWRFEKEDEDGVLEVKFRNGDAKVELAVRCVRGVPTRVED